MKKRLFPVFLLLCGAWSACKQDCFDLEVFVNDRPGRDVREGTVQIKIGKRDPLPAQKLNEIGKTIFTCIPLDQQNDTVQIIYAPVFPKPVRYIDQNAYTAAENRKMRFTIDFPPEVTTFEWSLRDRDSSGIVGAKITLDHKYIIESGEGGYFSTSVPKVAGDSVHFLVEKAGKTLINRYIIIQPEYRRLFID
jgi:hypothetical protein